jgi:hypothetical protein
MIVDHKRDSRPLHIEWACVPDVVRYCIGRHRHLAGDRQLPNYAFGSTARNVQDVTDQVMHERLMLELGTRGREVGRV